MSFLILTSALLNTTYAQLPKSYNFQPKGDPIYVVDGIVTNKSSLDKLNPDEIELMSVLKGEKATEKYGAKAINGVIEITTKKDNAVNNNIGISITGSPIYVIDGVEKSSFDIDKLNSDDVESMNILKGEKAISKYGDKGKNGVVVITTKKNENVNSVSKSIDALRNSNSSVVDPIYILDGKILEKSELEKLDRDKVEMFIILKGDDAISKYGEKAKNGVVIIELKKE